MALFGRDYDQDYGRDFDPGGNFSGRWSRGPGYRGGQRAGSWTGEDDAAYYGSMRGYTGGGANRGYGNTGYGSAGYTNAGYSGSGYDRSLRAGGYDRGYQQGYDRNYKSRWQTDYGDPFGDRQAHTPMRIMRGGFDEQYEREHRDRGGWFGGGRERYERDYSSNPMGYDPYRNRESSMERGWGMRSFGRGSRYGGDYRSGGF